MLTLKNSLQTRLWLAATIIISIICILGIPFTQWGFKTDDWANILHSKLTSWNDVKIFFTEGNMERFNHPSNMVANTGSFLQGLYRPMSFIFYYPQTLLFGTQAYGYFLVTVAIHSLNAGLFFLILSNFFNISASFLAALLFGFHPSLQNWLGWISAQTYFIELLFLGFIFITFYRWLQTRDIKWYTLSMTLFFINLLLKEATIILPGWIFVATLIYTQTALDFSQNTLKTFLRAFKNSLGFVCVGITYCLCRLYSMPFRSNNTSTLGFALSWESFIAKQVARAMQFLTYFYDILGLTWLPKGHRLMNGIVLLSILIILTILFIKSYRKKLILFCLFSTLIFSWPGLLMHYQPRYMYMALPWVITIFVILLESILSKIDVTLDPESESGMTNRSSCSPVIANSDPGSILASKIIANCSLKGLYYTVILAYIAGSGIYVFANMQKREFILHWLDSSMHDLVKKDLLAAGWRQEPLYFFGLPAHWFAMGTAQAVWFLNNAATNAYPVYQCGPTLYMPHQEHVWAVPRTNTTTVTTTLQDENSGLITLNNNYELRFLETSKDDLNIEFIISSNFRTRGLWLITWDYAHAKFHIVGYLPPA
jgi:hypothetical protein